MNKLLAACLAAGLLAPLLARADNGDPTPRLTLDPRDEAKVRQVMANRWHDFGIDQNTITRTINQGAGGIRGCVTNVGPAPDPNATPSLSSGRYGPKPQSSTTVVTGSVINVCR